MAFWFRAAMQAEAAKGRSMEHRRRPDPGSGAGPAVERDLLEQAARRHHRAPAPLALGSADLSYLLQIYPAGATSAQIATAGTGLPQTGVINNPVYFSYNFQQANVLNLNVAGLDVSANYRWIRTLAASTWAPPSPAS
jgi:hypothetical protein